MVSTLPTRQPSKIFAPRPPNSSHGNSKTRSSKSNVKDTHKTHFVNWDTHNHFPPSHRDDSQKNSVLSETEPRMYELLKSTHKFACRLFTGICTPLFKSAVPGYVYKEALSVAYLERKNCKIEMKPNEIRSDDSYFC